MKAVTMRLDPFPWIKERALSHREINRQNNLHIDVAKECCERQ